MGIAAKGLKKQTSGALNIKHNIVPIWDTPIGSLGSIDNTKINIDYDIKAHDSNDNILVYSLYKGSLPVGCKLSSDGHISGVVSKTTSDEVYDFVVNASNGISNVKRSFTLHNPSVNNNIILNTTVNEYKLYKDNDVYIDISASSDTNLTYSIVAGELPDMMTFDCSQGIITGTVEKQKESLPISKQNWYGSSIKTIKDKVVHGNGHVYNKNILTDFEIKYNTTKIVVGLIEKNNVCNFNPTLYCANALVQSGSFVVVHDEMVSKVYFDTKLVASFDSGSEYKITKKDGILYFYINDELYIEITYNNDTESHLFFGCLEDYNIKVNELHRYDYMTKDFFVTIRAQNDEYYKDQPLTLKIVA